MTAKSEQLAAMKMINREAERENDWTGFFSAGEKSSSSAKEYALQIVATGMKDRTAPSLEPTDLQKEISRTRP